MFGINSRFEDVRKTFIAIRTRISVLETKAIDLPNTCHGCGVNFKAGTGKSIPWKDKSWFISPGRSNNERGLWHYCSWCKPDYDKAEYINRVDLTHSGWKYFKCEEVVLETKEDES